jgi:hypothetical protein
MAAKSGRPVVSHPSLRDHRSYGGTFSSVGAFVRARHRWMSPEEGRADDIR